MIIYRTGSPVRAPHKHPAPPPPKRKPAPLRATLTAFRAKAGRPPQAIPRPARARVTIPHPARGPVSPYINPFSRGGVTGSRIDQGVDYSAAPATRIGALGPGRIVEALSTGSGWPGGGFIAEQLSRGPARGQVVYTAEDVAPAVITGQRVKAGQVIGKFTTGGSIESGWGTLPPNTGQALAYGRQSAPGPDPGAYSTGFGIAFDKLIRALGGPAGVMQGTISGSAPPMFSATGGASVGGRPVGHARVSLPPPVGPVAVPSGVHPAGGGGGGVRLMAVESSGGAEPRKPKPVLWPVDIEPWRQHKPPPPPVPSPVPVPVTTITSKLGTGGITAPPPPAASTSSGGMALLLVAGAGIILLIILMRKKKGSKGIRSGKR